MRVRQMAAVAMDRASSPFWKKRPMPFTLSEKTDEILYC
jgi:hypothetical protein